MIPVRRWPLFVGLYVALWSGPAMPAARWVAVAAGAAEVADLAWVGAWWAAVCCAVLAALAVCCTFPVQRASARLGRELAALRREDAR